MLPSHALSYQSPGYPLKNTPSGIYPLTKIVLPHYTLLYNDDAQVVFIEETSADAIFYIQSTPAEYHLLRALLRTPNIVVPFESLGTSFGEQFEYHRDKWILRKHLSRLKKKLPPTLKMVSVRNVGYAIQEQGFSSFSV